MFKRALGLGVALIVGVMLVSASGAATTRTEKVTRINVSTRAAVVHYLRSIHVNAKHAVIQRGLRNYAGAHCPGTRWTCAKTKHTVVQIAKRGGQNRFVCKGSKCVVVQLSGASHGVYTAGRIATASPSRSGGNSGYCVKTGSGTLSGGGQSCLIVQGASNSSASNTAGIYEVTSKVSGLLQTVQFAAEIRQTSSSGNNTACVTQGISQTANTANTNGKATNVSLEATQTILIKQNSATGDNSAVKGAVPTTGNCGSEPLSQYQNQTSIVTATGDITQNMNPTPNGLTDGNASIDIEQNQSTGLGGVKGIATGANFATFSQATNQKAVANTKAGKTVTQLQNSTDGDGLTTPFSGIVGTINQDSKGQSRATVTQDEIQCEDAANTTTTPGGLTDCSHTSDAVTGITLNQTQNGPVGLFTPPAKSTARVPSYHKGNGKSLQTGAGTGVVDIFNLTQTSSQYADTQHDPNTPLGTTVLQSNIMQGDCKSSGDNSDTGGSCAASQQATLNGVDSAGITNAGYTAGSIDDLHIKCTNGHDSCTATPPPVPVLTVTPDDPSEDTNPTFEWTEGGSSATNGISFECSVDSGTPASCNSGDNFPVGLGPHTFEVTASDNFGHTSDPTASFGWTVVPFLTFDVDPDGTGAFAGWQGGVPGSPIELTVGSPSGTTYAQFTLHNFEGVAVDGLAEPTFTTGTYSGGNPRYEVDFSDGNYAFGYPTQAGFDPASWELVQCTPTCASAGFMTWSDVKTAEAGTTVSAALIEVDGGVPAGTTFVISAFTFDGYSLSDFTNHWHNG